jgi:hypothetical protein
VSTDVRAEDLAAGLSPEPIELGKSHVEGLCEYVLEDEEILGAAVLTNLCDALKVRRRRRLRLRFLQRVAGNVRLSFWNREGVRGICRTCARR